MRKTLINGIDTDQLSVYDRSVQYGDGLFETIAVYDGEPRQWQRHMDRLQAGCARLLITPPDPDLLLQQVLSLSQGQRRAVIKIIVSRGIGERGFRISKDIPATIMVTISDWPEYPSDNRSRGVTITSCQTPLARQPRLAGTKHLNRMEQILARAEWTDEGIAEGILCDTGGNVIEGTMSNLFLIHSGVVITPELSHCGVAGTMRQLILEACEDSGIECRVEAVSLTQARDADEIFLTNSLIEVWPVRRWDDKTYTVNGVILTKLKNYINKKH